MKKIIFLLAMAVSTMACTSDKEYHIETSDGVVLYAHVRGRGEPCLYLHGGPGSGSTWMKEMGGKELERRYTMVYLDQRAVCRSTEPADDNFALSRQTLDFEEVRKALGFKKWHLLGHSFGGILEIAYWRDYPESIKGMIFEDCPLSMEDCFRDSWLPAAIEIVGEENADPVAKDSTASVGQRMAAIQQQLDNDTRALIFTSKENKHFSDTLNSWVFHTDCISHGKGETVMEIDDFWEDFRPLSSTVTVPVLYFIGKYDRAVGPESYKDLLFPNAVIKIGNCGHFPFLESPEEWAGALDEYQNLCKATKHTLETFSGHNSSDAVTREHLTKEQVLARVDELKELLGEKYWPTFDDSAYAMELNYYEDGPFRMHIVQDGKDAEPRMECSSPEITFRTIKGVKTYEEWYAMLLHECFHGFEHKKYPDCWNRMIETNPEDFNTADSLVAIRDHNRWYKDILDKENSLLIKMYESSSIDEVRGLFSEFLPLREKRLQMVKDKIGLDIIEFYPITEANEGGARYIEYSLYKEQGIKNTGWMLNLDSDSYYYASGLFLILIMEKCGIDFKNDLYGKYYTLTDLMKDKLQIS